MERTSNLDLPYIMPSQAQKHVTHNEAIRTLDALVALAVADDQLAAPPPTPAEGDRYVVPTGATGVWSSHIGEIAAWQDGGWSYLAPKEGWLAWCAARDTLIVCKDAIWRDLGEVGFARMAVNAALSPGDRFAVGAAASLFTHAGGDHRLTINKAAATDTASVLFQTEFSGRAEIGAAGSGDLSVKVSANGSTWHDGMTVGVRGTQTVAGFGTHDPERTLHVSAAYGEMLFEDPVQPADKRRFNIFLNSGGTAFRGLNDAGTDGTIWLYAKNDTGQIGMGTMTPTAGFVLDVAGAIRCTSLTQTSDGALKTVAGDAPGLDFVRRLNPVLFRWNEQEGRPGGRTHCGLIAQEVKAAADASGFDFGGYKSTAVREPEKPAEHMLDYAQFVAPLVKAVQELAARLDRIEGAQQPVDLIDA